MPWGTLNTLQERWKKVFISKKKKNPFKTQNIKKHLKKDFFVTSS
jgi:hypothetical protein